MICRESECTGCAACLNICEAGAVKMRYDSQGYLKAYIEKDQCINCGRCETACPVLRYPSLERNPRDVFAAWSKDKNVQKHGNSGGLFYEFAKFFIEKGGTVCAARYDKNFNVIHDLAECIEDLTPFQRSKFAQSDIRFMFREISRRLEQRQPVFFVGAPCQVAGLYTYLGQDSEYLLTAQFPCFGIPPGDFLKSYISQISNVNLNSIKDIFCEIQNNNNLNERIMGCELKNGEVITEAASKSSYVQIWNTALCLSDACCKCKFVTLPSISDIIWGNFWRIGEIEKFAPLDETYKSGCSMLILNSKKAEFYFDKIKNRLFYAKRSLREAISGHWMFQANYQSHILMRRYYYSAKRQEFQKEMCKSDIGYQELVEKYLITGSSNDQGKLMWLAKRIGTKHKAWIWRFLYYIQKYTKKMGLVGRE